MRQKIGSYWLNLDDGATQLMYSIAALCSLSGHCVRCIRISTAANEDQGANPQSQSHG
jgi:hypothetical protein